MELSLLTAIIYSGKLIQKAINDIEIYNPNYSSEPTSVTPQKRDLIEEAKEEAQVILEFDNDMRASS